MSNKKKLTLEEFRAWAIRHKCKEARKGCFEKTVPQKAPDGNGGWKPTGVMVDIRYKYTTSSIRKERLVIIPPPDWAKDLKPQRHWVRVASAYTRDVSIGPDDDKLVGLSARGCTHINKQKPTA